MASQISSQSSPLDLPGIPALVGAINLHEWKDMLTSTLCCRELERYIMEDIPEPEGSRKQKAWKRERATANLLIKSSLSKVRTVLQNAGWDPEVQNPKYHFDFVLREIAKTPDTLAGDVVLEFTHIDRAQFGSLAAYQSRVIYLRRRLTELDCAVSEKMCIWVTINGLKGRYSRWYNSLARAMNTNTLSWDSLMQEMTARAIKEHPTQPLSSPAKEQDMNSS